MVAIQEEVPVMPAAVYGTQFWKICNFAPCSLAFGHAIDFSTLPKNGRGYREATAEIEHTIHRLFDWLAERGVDEEELRRVFNLGIGMCAVVPEAPADALVIGRLT